MNKGLIKYKTKILNYLDENGYQIFNLDQLKMDFGDDFSKIFRALNSLYNEGVLQHLQKGLYCRPGFSDQNVLALFLSPEGGIAYWSALHYHGLTSQFSNTVFVQTPKLIRSKTLLGTNFKFIKVKPEKCSMFQQVGRGNSKFYISSYEKALIDCFDALNYSPGWEEMIRALYKSKPDSTQMIKACEAVNNISAIKRIGYLAELMDMENMNDFQTYALSKVNNKYNLLDPGSREKGPYLARWRLRLNETEVEIDSTIHHIY